MAPLTRITVAPIRTVGPARRLQSRFIRDFASSALVVGRVHFTWRRTGSRAVAAAREPPPRRRVGIEAARSSAPGIANWVAPGRRQVTTRIAVLLGLEHRVYYANPPGTDRLTPPRAWDAVAREQLCVLWRPHFVAPPSAGLIACTTPVEAFVAPTPPVEVVRTFRSAVGTTVHRPSADAGARRRERNDDTSGRRAFAFRRGVWARVKARSAWNVSLVTRPCHTRFQIASTVSPGYPAPTAS